MKSLFPSSKEIVINENGHKNESLNEGAIFLAACDYITEILLDPTKVYDTAGKPNRKIIVDFYEYLNEGQAKEKKRQSIIDSIIRDDTDDATLTDTANRKHEYDDIPLSLTLMGIIDRKEPDDDNIEYLER